MIVVILLIGVVSFHFSAIIQLEDLKIIKGTLQQDPKFDTGAHGAGFLELDLEEDQNRYLTDGLAYAGLDKEGIRNDLKAGDTVEMYFSKDYGFGEKINSISNIHKFFILKSNDKEYLSLKNYNSGRIENVVFFYVVWLIVFAVFMYWLIKNKRTITAPQASAQDHSSKQR